MNDCLRSDGQIVATKRFLGGDHPMFENSILQPQKKWALFHALWSGRPALNKPFFITLDITPRCNLTCVGCPYHSQWMTGENRWVSSKTDISLEIVKQVALKLQGIPGLMLYLEGSGEPFVHPEIMKIVKILKEAGLKLTIFTNGTLLNAHLIEELIDNRVNRVRVSIWAGSESSFERNYPGSNKKHFRRIIENLQHFQRLRRLNGAMLPNVDIFFVINKLNKVEIPAIVELAHQNHCDGLSFGQFISWDRKIDAINFDRQERTALMKELKKYKEVLEKKSLGHTLDHDIDKLAFGPDCRQISPCLISWFHLRILTSGDVVPCCRSSYPLGNIVEQSFFEIWDGPAINEFRRRAAAPDGHDWLKAQGTDCHDCPYIVEMRKLYLWKRLINKITGRCN